VVPEYDPVQLRAKIADLKARLDTATSTKAAADELKARADTAKAEAERRKIELELDPVAGNYQAGMAQYAKILADTAKTEAETNKLALDTRLAWRGQVWEVIKSAGATGLAVAAIWTAYNAFDNHRDDEGARHRNELSHLIEGLGSHDLSPRVASAIGLRPALSKSEPMRPIVIDALAYTMSTESDATARQAMAEGLTEAGQDALAPLRRVLPRLNAEVKTGHARIAYATTAEDKARETQLVLARQASMIDIALAIATISGTAPASKRTPDFSNLNFKAYPLYGVAGDLRGALFRKTIVWQADLYGLDLSAADFTDAEAAKASFREAQLAGAVFDGADLSGGDFTGTKGLTESQFAHVKDLSCAIFDRPLRDTMKSQTQANPGKRCEQ
jgi:hypothetical protein